MPDWATNTIVSVASTLLASVIGGAALWAHKSYRKFVGMENHLATIAECVGSQQVRQKRQGKRLVAHGDQIEDHEGRIVELERGAKEE